MLCPVTTDGRTGIVAFRLDQPNLCDTNTAALLFLESHHASLANLKIEPNILKLSVFSMNIAMPGHALLLSYIPDITFLCKAIVPMNRCHQNIRNNYIELKVLLPCEMVFHFFMSLNAISRNFQSTKRRPKSYSNKCRII
jgi:hypothetical protein